MTAVSYSPTATDHDASENAGTMEALNGATVILDAAADWGGLYVNAVADIATLAGATINSATLNYYPNNTTRDDPNVIWYGEANDTAAVFTTGASDISGRSRTTANATDSGTAVGTGLRTVTITSIIAEITSRPGWTGPIVLVGDGQTGTNLRLLAYDNGSNIWSIDIDYTAAGGGPAHVTRKIGRIRLMTKVGGVLA